MTLTLADVLSPFLIFDFAAVIQASGNTTLYADDDRGGTDEPVEGELGMSPTNTVISRIRWLNGSSTLSINDNDAPEALSLSEWFGNDGGGRGLTMHLVVEDANGVATIHTAKVDDVAGGAGRRTGSSANFRGFPAAMITAFSGISEDDFFILAMSTERDKTMPIAELQYVVGPLQQLAKSVSTPIDISADDFEDVRGFAIMNATAAAGNITFTPLDGSADVTLAVAAGALAGATPVVFLAKAVKSSSVIESIRAVHF